MEKAVGAAQGREAGVCPVVMRGTAWRWGDRGEQIAPASRRTPAAAPKSHLPGSLTAAMSKLTHGFLAFSVVAIEATSLNFCF